MRYKGRPEYISTLSSYIDVPVIKILVGNRQSGKSAVLKMFKDKLLLRGVEEDVIVGYDPDDIVSMVENIVYIGLLRRGWHPFFVKFGDKEINFLLGGVI